MRTRRGLETCCERRWGERGALVIGDSAVGVFFEIFLICFERVAEGAQGPRLFEMEMFGFVVLRRIPMYLPLGSPLAI